MKDIEKIQTVEEILEFIEEFEQTQTQLDSPEDLEILEREISACTNRLAALLLQKKIQTVLDSDEHQLKESSLVKDMPGRMKSEGMENLNVLVTGGCHIKLSVRYYRRSCDRRKGKRYKGLYAGTVLLGIHERCTPAMAGLVSAKASLLGSFGEVRMVLSEQGINLDVKVIRRIAYRFAERARVCQQAELIPFDDNDHVDGRRIVVSTDGGRVRLRENKRGPKTKKNRTRYNGAWREPKILIIFAVDEQGKMEKSFCPLIDGYISKPDTLFCLMEGYLQAIGIRKVDRVLFVSDGAQWIWNRIPALILSLGLEPCRVHQLIDFYHAVEHLGKVAALRKKWSAKERKAWIAKQRRLLLKGEAVSVVKAVQNICKGRNGKKIATERNYFVKNIKRMNYPEMKALHLPMGSGAVESAVRRVINLRLKGPGIFWRKKNAEKMILLRSYYKACRWNQLKKLANSHLSIVEG